jgi:hypothetical protein
MPRSEILARYRRLRQISKEQHEAVLNRVYLEKRSFSSSGSS